MTHLWHNLSGSAGKARAPLLGDVWKEGRKLSFIFWLFFCYTIVNLFLSALIIMTTRYLTHTHTRTHTTVCTMLPLETSSPWERILPSLSPPPASAKPQSCWHRLTQCNWENKQMIENGKKKKSMWMFIHNWMLKVLAFPGAKMNEMWVKLRGDPSQNTGQTVEAENPAK